MGKGDNDHGFLVYDRSPWDYDRLIRDEEKIINSEASDEIKSFIHGEPPTTQSLNLDTHQRRFIYILSRPLLSLKKGYNLRAIEKYIDAIFFAPNLAEANAYNNWFLRFPECSPSFVWRELGSGVGLQAFVSVSLCVHGWWIGLMRFIED